MAYQLEHTLAAVFRSTYASATSAPSDGPDLLVVERRLNTMIGGLDHGAGERMKVGALIRYWRKMGGG